MRLFFFFFFFSIFAIYFENISIVIDIVIDSIDLSGFFGICRFLNNNTIKIKNFEMGEKGEEVNCFRSKNFEKIEKFGGFRKFKY